MAEKRLRYLLKVPIVSWSANSIVPAVLFALWRLNDSGIWLGVAILFGIALGLLNGQAFRAYRWIYCGIWIVALVALSYATEATLIVALSIFFGVLLFMLLGVAQVRFRDPFKQLSICYFLLVFSAAGLFALQGPIEHMLGASLLMLLFLYLTGREYLTAEIGYFNSRTRAYLIALALVSSQVLWIASLISIGFLNIASLILVLHMVSMTSVVHHFNGMLTKRALAKDVLFFAGFSAIILIISAYA